MVEQLCIPTKPSSNRNTSQKPRVVLCTTIINLNVSINVSCMTNINSSLYNEFLFCELKVLTMHLIFNEIKLFQYNTYHGCNVIKYVKIASLIILI